VTIGREAIGAFQRGQVLFGTHLAKVCFEAAVQAFDRRWRRRRNYR
jgi:hypothetical protein